MKLPRMKNWLVLDRAAHPEGGVREHSSERTKPGLWRWLGGQGRTAAQFGDFPLAQARGGAGGKVPIPHALHPFLSTSDVDKRVAKEFGLIGLGGPCH